MEIFAQTGTLSTQAKNSGAIIPSVESQISWNSFGKNIIFPETTVQQKNLQSSHSRPQSLQSLLLSSGSRRLRGKEGVGDENGEFCTFASSRNSNTDKTVVEPFQGELNIKIGVGETPRSYPTATLRTEVRGRFRKVVVTKFIRLEPKKWPLAEIPLTVPAD